ncbi:hypothetical protein F8388_019198 [Cannabis sativa]|uniref:Uncharacterized protein n=1 Tax=Cannabis sativa TaxID=3483 RepID=A0A7J6F5G6_CANSA|nr:hypothetical protein F8388_019198 [Cannabis sativa]
MKKYFTGLVLVVLTMSVGSCMGRNFIPNLNVDRCMVPGEYCSALPWQAKICCEGLYCEGTLGTDNYCAAVEGCKYGGQSCEITWIDTSNHVIIMWECKRYQPGALLRKHIDATLGSGNLREAVKLPTGEDLNEWLAVNNAFSSVTSTLVNLLHGTLTAENCPTMTAGPKYKYLNFKVIASVCVNLAL